MVCSKTFSKYVGVPWEHKGREGGLDCWGLVRLFYQQEYSIKLPLHSTVYSNDDGQITHKLAKDANVYTNHPLYETNNPKPGDIILFRILGHPIHVGIYISEREFLHTQRSSGSVITNFRNWRKRIVGFYTRHNQ